MNITNTQVVSIAPSALNHFAYLPAVSLSQFLSKAKQHRTNTTSVINGRSIDEFGRDITAKKPRSYTDEEPLKFASHLYTVSDIVKDVQRKRETCEDWTSPARTLDQMRFKLTEALEYLICDFDYYRHPDSNPANTARILAQTLLTINDYFEIDLAKSHGQSCSQVFIQLNKGFLVTFLIHKSAK